MKVYIGPAHIYSQSGTVSMALRNRPRTLPKINNIVGATWGQVAARLKVSSHVVHVYIYNMY